MPWGRRAAEGAPLDWQGSATAGRGVAAVVEPIEVERVGGGHLWRAARVSTWLGCARWGVLPALLALARLGLGPLQRGGVAGGVEGEDEADQVSFIACSGNIVCLACVLYFPNTWISARSSRDATATCRFALVL